MLGGKAYGEVAVVGPVTDVELSVAYGFLLVFCGGWSLLDGPVCVIRHPPVLV